MPLRIRIQICFDYTGKMGDAQAIRLCQRRCRTTSSEHIGPDFNTLFTIRSDSRSMIGSMQDRVTRLLALVILLGGIFLAAFVAAAESTPACADEPGFQQLDFWLGEWRVVNSAGQLQGVNRIEKVLEGFAVVEHWTGASGNEGKSWFYYNYFTGEWSQIWITQNSTQSAGIKEKKLVESRADGGVRFQGRAYIGKNQSVLDRTTLTPLDDGRVHQVIEWSPDEGNSWNLSFDAYYVPAQPGNAAHDGVRQAPHSI